MKKIIGLFAFMIIAIGAYAQIDSANVIPKLSIKDAFGIDNNSFAAAIVANVLMVIGFYAPILYNYSVKGVVQKTFLQPKQLIAMNVLIFIVATTLVLMPGLATLLSSIGFTFDVENTKPSFIILGFALYTAKLTGKLLSENKELKLPSVG